MRAVWNFRHLRPALPLAEKLSLFALVATAEPASTSYIIRVHALALLLCHRGNWAGCVRTPIYI